MRSQKGFISLIVGTIALLVIAVAVGGYVTWQSRIPQDDGTTPNLYSYGKRKAPPPTPPRQGKVCTQDAKQCPDGSFVSRQGPTCEFAACPGEKLTPQSAIPTNWKTYRNKQYGFGFQYPAEWSELDKLDDPYGVGFWWAEKNMATMIMDIETMVNLSLIGISYCGAHPQGKRCESLKTESGNYTTIDWDIGGKANAMFSPQDGTFGASFTLLKVSPETKNIFRKILSTFKFIK